MVIKQLEVSESRGPHGKKSQYKQRGQDRILQLQRHGGLGRPPWTPHAPCSHLRMMGKGCSGEVGVARLVSSDRLSLLAHPGWTPWLIGVVPVGVIILNSGGRTALLRPAGSCRFSVSLASVPLLLSEYRRWCRPLWVSVLWGGVDLVGVSWGGISGSAPTNTAVWQLLQKVIQRALEQTPRFAHKDLYL